MQKIDKISVIVPVYNEEKVINKTIESLLALESDGFEVEYLLVDGMSTDTTREIIQARNKIDKRIQLLDNPNRKTPYAMNIGLSAATGNYVAILGAHCNYQSNYLSVCLQELKAKNAAGCSGKAITHPRNNSLGASLAFMVMGSAFGVSGSSFRTQGEGFAESIPYPVFRKDVLLNLGGYNEILHRNQDNDMNERIIQAGHKLYLTARTTAHYYAPASVSKLLKYGYTNGLWNAVSLYINPKSMRLRHLIPAIFTSGILFLTFCAFVGFLLGWEVFSKAALALLAAGVLLHLLAGIIFSLKIAVSEKNITALLLPFIFFAFHFMYGLGTLNGIFVHRNIKRNAA